MKQRNGLSEKEAGKLGGAKTKIINLLKKEQRIKVYNKNPKLCKLCGKPLLYEKRFNNFCSLSCAVTYNNLKRDKSIYLKLKETLLKTLSIKLCNKKKVIQKQNIKLYNKKKQNIKLKIKSVKICKYCGLEICEHPDICKKWRIFKSLVKFGFDYNIVGTNKLYDEYNRVRDIISNFYQEHNSNDKLLKETFDYTSGPANFLKLLKSLGIKSKNISEAITLSYLNGNNVSIGHTKYHEEWHTTWDNKEVFLRSSYELDFAKKLDEQKILYEVEGLRIKYYDSTKLRYRCAIPDFYLPETNEIIEIKSLWTIKNKVLELKDKFIEYIKLGYNPKLILLFKEFENLDEITEKYIEKCKQNNNLLI